MCSSDLFKFITPINLYSKNLETFTIPEDAWTLGQPAGLGATINLLEFYKTYNISDCEGLYKCMAIFMRMLSAHTRVDFTNCLTAPSIAIKAMKATCSEGGKMQQRIYKINGPAKTFITQSYFGGRCEAVFPQIKDGKHHDINSMYAAAFCKPMPVGVPMREVYNDGSMTMGRVRQEMASRIGFLDVTVKLSQDTLDRNPMLAVHPLLPLRTE